LNEHLTRIVASCEPRGQSYEVERLLEAAREDGAQALVLLGDIGAGEEAREYAKVLRTVGREAGVPAFYVPGPGDAPFGKYLREAHNTEVVFPTMHGVHGTFAFADGFHLLFAGMGGEVADDPRHEREERERLSYPGWEVEYWFKVLRETKDYQKVFLFHTPPTHKGLHEGGSEILAELVKTYAPRLVLTGGETFGQEYLGTSLVVAPGRLSEGGYALVDLHEREAQEKRL
jgi:Icc-related predicted phosphoesterase